MSERIKIVETPIEEGVEKEQVRTALRKQFSGFRVSGILRDEENSRWLARLVEQVDRVHHRVADDEEKKPFPLKGLGDEDSEDSDEEEPKTNEDDDELKPDEKPAPDDKADVKGELGELVKKLKDLLPALEKVVGPMPEEIEEEAEKPLPHPEDVGPTPGGGTPPGGPPRGAPPPGARPPRSPGVPGGRGGRPPVRPQVGVPTFTKRKSQLLQRTADVSEDDARKELESAFPDYEIAEFKENGGLYLVRLELKS